MRPDWFAPCFFLLALLGDSTISFIFIYLFTFAEAKGTVREYRRDRRGDDGPVRVLNCGDDLEKPGQVPLHRRRACPEAALHLRRWDQGSAQDLQV